jgi:hypothetical protein
MKINNGTNKKKRIIIIGCIVLALILIAAATTLAYRYYHPTAKSTDSVNLSPPTDEEKNAGNSAKQNNVSPETDKGNSTGSDSTPTQPTDGSKATIAAEITSANQNDPSFQVRVLIHTVTSSGTCTLVMSGPNGKSYNATAEVQALPSSSTCKGFDVPVSSLAAGQWKVNVIFSNDQYTASADKDVVIQ